MKLPQYNRFSTNLIIVFAVLAIGILFVAPHLRTAAAQTRLILPVDPRATFLHTAMADDPEVSDNPSAPTVVDLAQAGLMPGTEIKLTYQILEPFSYICGTETLKYNDPLFMAVFAGSNNLLPPAESHRIPDAIKAGDELRTGPCGLSEKSEPDDIPEDFQILPTSGTTIRIPEGATQLFLGIVDSYYKDNCGQLAVTIERAQTFDICLQDNENGDTLLVNSFTGDYRFIRCGADSFVHNDTGGRRAINRIGCTITLNDTLVSAVVDVCRHRGSATIKNPNVIGVRFSIQDNYTKDNTGSCPTK